MIRFVRRNASDHAPVIRGALANCASGHAVGAQINRCVRKKLNDEKVGKILARRYPGKAEHARDTRLLGSGRYNHFTER
jgi:hypothetical protein